MTTVLLCLTYLATLTFLYYHNKSTAIERRELYDRIHAKDFVEFKQMTEVVEPKPKEEKENNYIDL